MKYYIFALFLLFFACVEEPERKSIEISPEIGDVYGGGVVFYIFLEGVDDDYIEGETHGLIMGVSLGLFAWGCTEVPFDEMTSSGDHNTSTINEYCTNDNAAYNCLITGQNDQFDWWLPSVEEFELIVESELLLDNSYYWTSSKHSYPDAYCIKPINGETIWQSVNASLKTLPIRQF